MTRLRSTALTLLLLATIPRAATAASCVVKNGINPTGIGTVWTLGDSVAVASQSDVKTDCLNLSKGGFFGAWYRCTGSAPDVLLKWQVSPTKENADFVDDETIDLSAGATAELHPIHSTPMLYGRIRLVGNAGNGAGTSCTVRVFVQGVRE